MCYILYFIVYLLCGELQASALTARYSGLNCLLLKWRDLHIDYFAYERYQLVSINTYHPLIASRGMRSTCVWPRVGLQSGHDSWI